MLILLNLIIIIRIFLLPLIDFYENWIKKKKFRGKNISQKQFFRIPFFFLFFFYNRESSLQLLIVRFLNHQVASILYNRKWDNVIKKRTAFHLSHLSAVFQSIQLFHKVKRFRGKKHASRQISICSIKWILS